MGLIRDHVHLTVTNPSLETARAQTYPGMAHFAGSGPSQRTCRECLHWTGCGLDSGHFAKKGIHAGQLKPRACGRYRSLMQGDVGPGVPHNVRACKYFEDNPAPPPIFAKS